ncbi:MAG: S8 family serine peptidase [Reichenbachiella sp.]|uniref:S8 family peptidase n=1 Tax=Reichenbachiella sp. TaxID=2184521 RepID=UPI003263E16A
MNSIKNWVIIVSAVVITSCGGHHQDPPVCLDENATDYHMVIFRGSANSLLSMVTRVGGTVERIHPEIGVATVSGLSERAAKRLGRSRSVMSIGSDIEVDWLRERVDEIVETDGGVSARIGEHKDPTTAAFYNVFQWNMRTIGSTEAWELEQGDESVRIAIVDSGISDNHFDLDGKYDISSSMNFTSSDPTDLVDFNGHGTQVAGIISTNNHFIAGLAPHTTLIGIKVLEDDGSGNFSDLVAGIMHAVDGADADIINISFGSHFSPNYYLCSGLRTSIAALKKAIQYANTQGVLVVAAAGDGDDMYVGHDLGSVGLLHFPSQFHQVLSVGANAPINQQDFDSLTSYSNYGRRAVDVVAPGGNDLLVDGTFLDGIMTAVSPELVNGSTNRYNTTSGTGISAAHVSALAALISAQNSETLSPYELKQKIKDTADDLGVLGKDELYGAGRINAYRALTE